jgi:hypothetical protein
MALEPIWYIFKLDLFDLVVLIHCCILIPQCFLRHSQCLVIGFQTIAVDEGIVSATVRAPGHYINASQNDSLFV